MLTLCQTINEFKQALAKPGPILGIDYGKVRTGLGISDSERIFALPHSVISTPKYQEIIDLIVARHIVGVVIGYPLESSGKAGNACEEVVKFVKTLAKTELDIPYYFQDERLTTKLSNTLLKGANMTRKKRAVLDNSVAATNILQTVLDLLKG